MKKDELKKLRLKGSKDLKNKIVELKKEVAAKKLEKAAGKLKNVAEIGKVRRDLAQTATILQMLEFESELTDSENQGKELA